MMKKYGAVCGEQRRSLQLCAGVSERWVCSKMMDHIIVVRQKLGRQLLENANHQCQQPPKPHREIIALVPHNSGSDFQVGDLIINQVRL